MAGVWRRKWREEKVYRSGEVSGAQAQGGFLRNFFFFANLFAWKLGFFCNFYDINFHGNSCKFMGFM